ncbi:hypothetical protein GCM10022237_27130 [Nocardioides ginsengisoli]|uniref:Secreted protein n=1 Tax=Nocardioides ginsengisoli TaxID=363868 RepID=A0ABW3W2G7_9ACTN
MLKKAVLATALAMASILAFAGSASASTVWDYYDDSAGRAQGYFRYVDCDAQGNESYQYRCQGSDFDGLLQLSDYGLDGRPTRVQVHTRIGGTWHSYLDRWLPDGAKNIRWASGSFQPVGALIRVKLCIYKADYATLINCTTRYTTNSYYN